MKILKYLLMCSLLMAFAVACDKGLDPINPVAPGTDESAPSITFTFPIEGSLVRDTNEVSSIIFKFETVDDIELKTVSLQLDGIEIKMFNSFLDYRRAVIEYTYNDLHYGDHVFTVVSTDLSGKSTTQSVNFKKVEAYQPMDGEIVYMPFDGDYTDLVKFQVATVVGSPGLAEGKYGQAYAGATGAYLTFPTTEIIKTKEVSASMWMKVNAVPDRAGILTMSPEDATNPGFPAIQNKRTSGFRFFREANGALQRFKLNVGLGGANESWNDGGMIDPTVGGWMHFVFMVSGTTSTIYINGEKALEASLLNPIDWTGCNLLCIMSGVPRFTEWNHFSDLSLLDDLRIFNRALTADEVNALYVMKK